MRSYVESRPARSVPGRLAGGDACWDEQVKPRDWRAEATLAGVGGNWALRAAFGRRAGLIVRRI